MLRDLAGREVAPGLVALRDGRAIGWVGLGPREDFDRLEHSRVRPRLDDLPVWSVLCFVVSKSARGEGIARRLLDAAIDYARDRGAPAVEAYPVVPADERIDAAKAYTGVLSMFEDVGFREVREVESPTATVRRTIVRLDLGGIRAGVTTATVVSGGHQFERVDVIDTARPARVEFAAGMQAHALSSSDGGRLRMRFLSIARRTSAPVWGDDGGRFAPISS